MSINNTVRIQSVVLESCAAHRFGSQFSVKARTDTFRFKTIDSGNEFAHRYTHIGVKDTKEGLLYHLNIPDLTCTCAPPMS